MSITNRFLTRNVLGHLGPEVEKVLRLHFEMFGCGIQGRRWNARAKRRDALLRKMAPTDREMVRYAADLLSDAVSNSLTADRQAA